MTGGSVDPIAGPEDHVVVEFRSADRRWVVRQDGSRRATSLHSTRSDAEHVARRMARNQRKNVTVMAPDGGVAQRYDYSSTPRNRSRLVRSPRGIH